MSGNENKSDAGFKKPPKHSQFKKGRSGNPRGRPRKYDPAAERKQLKALLALLGNQPHHGFTGKGKRVKRLSRARSMKAGSW